MLKVFETVARFALAVFAIFFLATAEAAAQAPTYSGSEVAKHLVVRITGSGVDGAGIVVDVDDEYLYGVTAKHVVRSRGKIARDLEGRLRSWRTALPLAVIKGHPMKDLAAFRIAYGEAGVSKGDLLTGLPFNRLGDSRSIDGETGLHTIGHSAAGGWIDNVDPAYIASHDISSSRDDETLQFRLQCPGGHSGGGLFDDRWRLVGMTTDYQEPFCHALRIESVLLALAEWGMDYRLVPGIGDGGGEVPVPSDDEIVVAVVDFDNRSGVKMPDIGPAGRDITTSFLYDLPGIRVVTRDRLQSVLRELHLQPTVGSTSGASRLGKLLDADAIVTGSVNRYDEERRTFKGYNTSAAADTYHMSITLQIIEVDTGLVKFSRTYETESKKVYQQGSSAPRQFLRLESELLRTLLDDAKDDVQLALREVSAGVDAPIRVEIVSFPAQAEIVVGSTYVGTTPKTLDLSIGLHEIEVRKAGYQIWRRKVRVEPDMPAIEVRLSR